MGGEKAATSHRGVGVVGPQWLFILLGAALAVVGLTLLVGGLRLASLGGSWYYLLAGGALTMCGVLLCRGDLRAIWLFAFVYLATIGWAIWEAGFSFWPQTPRLGPFVVMGAIMAWALGRLDPMRRRLSRGLVGVQLAVIVAAIGGMFFPHGLVHADGSAAPATAEGSRTAQQSDVDWRYYGRDSGGGHYVPFDQIDRGNVSKLKVAWTFRTGEINETADLEATPIQIGDSIYFCTSHNRVFALDADTGRKRWSFDPKVDAKGSWNRCRGVGYYDTAERQAAGPGDQALQQPVVAESEPPCGRRIIATTVDARLFALDAQTGRPCEGFGDHGVVDLKRGLGPFQPGWYYPTSAPLVAKGHVIVGGWVSDNQSTDEPGGVVRAFDANTGKLLWAWDPGRTNASRAPSPERSFVRSTPNYWGTATFDPQLGLIFVPTGNGTPDHWGGKRSKETDAYSTSVIALDVDTGRLVWHYQTVHHDLWDYDLSAPPTFVDMPDGRGGRVPSLVQVGKAGQIFVLDRRTGRPVTPVIERRAPQDVAPGDHISPRQPFSVGMPQVIRVNFSEKTMWGATFFDQLACRIRFRQMHYEGQYTPPGLVDTPITPGYLGGMNWGGVAIDRSRDMLLVNDIRLATIVRLVPRKDVDGKLQANFSHAGYELHPQAGAPYGAELKSFLSPIGLPCEQPPWGMITAIDLTKRKIAWQIPAGTLSESMGNATGVFAPLPIGMPTLSSSIVTATGLTFYSGTNDAFIRAWDTRTGKQLWKGALPVGSQSTPMSYVSPKTNRQYIVTLAGGTPYSPRKGDYVIAYALTH